MTRLGRLAIALSLLLAPAARGADRSAPPKPGPVRPLHLPPLERLSLDNGLDVLLMEKHQVPVVEVVLVVRTGAAADPAGKEGLAAMTADMLDEGAGGRDALALADALDFLGAELTTGASWDDSTVRLRVPVERLTQALPLLADVALHPDFPESELGRLRREALTDLLQARDAPRQVASWALAQAVFGNGHRYGRPETGDAASLERLAVADLRGFHARRYTARNATLVVVGDVTPDVREELQIAFGAMPAGEPASAGVAVPRPVKGRKIWLVDKPGAAQSVIRIGQVGPAWGGADYAATEVMNTLLGGSFTSRLNDNLREQHGYTYGAGSRFLRYGQGGLFLAASDVQTRSTADALREFFAELKGIREPAPSEDVERARNYLALGYPQDLETTRQLASRLVEKVVYGLPDDFFESFVPKALAVDGDALLKAARAWVTPDDVAVVVVGDREKVLAPIQALGLGPVQTLTVDDVLGPAPRPLASAAP
jgi:zinc protease